MGKTKRLRSLLPVATGLEANAEQILDVAGLTVVPGFIDPHSHSDWSVLGNRDAQSTVRQGVTTEVVGNCGVTYAPLATDGVSAARDALRGHGYDGDVTWRSFGELLDVVHRYDGATAQNLAWLVGHTALRDAAGVRGEGADSRGVAGMTRYLTEAMEAGALGMSTGLEYGSGRDADTAELVSVAATLKKRKLVQFGQTLEGQLQTAKRSLDSSEIQRSPSGSSGSRSRSSASVVIESARFQSRSRRVSAPRPPRGASPAAP